MFQGYILGPKKDRFMLNQIDYIKQKNELFNKPPRTLYAQS